MEEWYWDAQFNFGNVEIEAPAGGVWMVHGIWVVTNRCYGLYRTCQAHGAIERNVDVCKSVPLFQIIS